MSRSSADDVSMTTGIDRVCGSDFKRFNTSNPSTFGSFRSSKMTFGRFESLPLPKIKSRASSPSRTTSMRFVRLFFFKACNASSTSLGLSSTNRISTGLWFIGASPFKSEIESGAFIQLRLSPHAATMPVDDTLDDGETDTGPFVFLSPVQALEHAKEFVHVAHVKASAIVFDKVNGFAVSLLARDFNLCDLAFAGVLEGIGEKVHEDLLEQGWIGPTLGKVNDGHLEPPAVLLGLQLFEDLSREISRRYGLFLKRLPAQPGEAQQVIDQLPHRNCVFLH